MNMTLQRLGFGAIGGNVSTLIMPIGILVGCDDGPAVAYFALGYFFYYQYFGLAACANGRRHISPARIF